MKRSIVFLFCLLTSYWLQAELCSFSGKAFDTKGQLLFQEEYVVEKQGDKILKVQTQFLSPKGDKLGLMSSYFENANFLPKVEFKKNQSSFEYGLFLFEKSVELFKKNSSAALKKKKLTQQDNMVAGHGFYFYILDKLDCLLQGEKHQMVFVQPNRLDCYTFNMKATPLKTPKDHIKVILTIDNALLKKIVPEIEIVIDKSTRSLVFYKGLSGFLSEEASLKTISIQYTALKNVDPSCQEIAFQSPIQP
jgi:hypothetical protein